MMKKILFPTDFSPAAHHAFLYAINLAKKAEYKIDVVHIYPEQGKGKELYMDPKNLHNARKEFQKNMEEKMAEFTKQYDSSVIRSKMVFPSDEATGKIIELSKRQYNLIIMGTKGERNALNKIIGSVTTNTMMNAHCPVLAVPSDTRFKNIQTITYSTSLKEKDEPFLKSLSEFANIFGASIEYLHVIVGSTVKAISKLKSKGLSSNAPNVHHVDNESILDGVTSFINENKTDILALFIPKRTFFDQLFHRSVTKQLVFYAGLPFYVANGK